MAKTLIVAEIQNGRLRESTLELVALARGKGDDVCSLVIGNGIGGVADELAAKGGGKVLVADDAALENYTLDAYADVTLRAVDAEKPELILFSNTPTGWDVAPKVAAALDAGIVTDVIRIESDTFVRRLFNAKFDAHFTGQGSPVVATVQPGALAPHEGSEAGSTEAIDASGVSSRSKFVGINKAEGGGHDLSKAEMIVSGGRGLQKPENFDEVLKPLVEALGAQMGASRPVVDAGWLPHEYQVGSSGQIVAPKLYLAVGISGAIQHLVGMKNSNYIAAINKDPDAPIFEIADVGIVGDLFEIVPALASAIGSAKG